MSTEYNDVMLPRLKILLDELIRSGGSDLHLKAGGRAHIRVQGIIAPLYDYVVSQNEMLTLAKEMLRGRFNELVDKKEVDLTFKLSSEYRFRVNIFFQQDGVSMAFRTISTNIKSIEDLHMPLALKQICELNRGLVLVTGSTGSGKSTTLAAIINEINKTKRQHIITIEDPIEFIHKDELSIINQRSIGEDAVSYADALKAALREDPDVILVGEMRDLEAIETALRAAETGHLVLSTLHTIDAKEAINRIIGVFPSSEQNRIRLTISAVLNAVISQRLVRTKDGSRRAAIEALLKTPRIQELIKQNRDDEIKDALAEGRDIYGTQTFDQALIELYKNDIIDEDEAIANATSPDNMRLLIQGESVSLSAKEFEIKLK